MKKLATTWSRPNTQGQAPRPRCSHASCITDHRLIIYGGWSSGNRFLDDVHVYSLETNTWSQPKISGDARVRVGHSMTPGENPNDIWVMGGTMGASSVLDVQVLNLETLSWSSPAIQGSPPEARSRHSANRCGHVIYLIGGGDNKRLFSDVWALDLRELTWSLVPTSGDAPSGRWGHTTTLIDTRLFVFGGHDGTNRLNDIHILDLQSNVWSRPFCQPKQSASPRNPLSSSSSSINDDGFDDMNSDTSSQASAEENTSSFVPSPATIPSPAPSSSTSSSSATPSPAPSDPSSSTTPTPSTILTRFGHHTITGQRSAIKALSEANGGGSNANSTPPGMPLSRAGHSANCIGRKLIIYGGGDGKLLGDMYCLNVDTFEWSAMESGNVPDRCAHTSEVFQSSQGPRILVFGGSNGIKTFNDLYIVVATKNKKRRSSEKRKSNSFIKSPAAAFSSSQTPELISSSPSPQPASMIPAVPIFASSQSSNTAASSTQSPAIAQPSSPKKPGTIHIGSPTKQNHKKDLPEGLSAISTKLQFSSSSPQSPISPKSSPRAFQRESNLNSTEGSHARSSPRGNSRPVAPASSEHANGVQSGVSHDMLFVLLKEVGLEKYHQRFVEQEITIDQISSLNDTHYQALGLNSIRDKALMAKLKEKARAPSPCKPRTLSWPHPGAKAQSATPTPSPAATAPSTSTPNNTTSSAARATTNDLVRQVQMSTDALASAANSLRAVLSEDS